MKNEKLIRTFIDCEIRAESREDGTAVLVGRPVVFNKETVIGGMFREVIKNGALDGADLSDVLLLVNHEDGRIPLARSRASKRTMDIKVDSEGLYIEAVIDVENNPDARAVYSAIQRGDLSGMSFAFRVASNGEKWQDYYNGNELPLRTITAIEGVHEVSIVNKPAYKDTTVVARSEREHLDAIREQMESRNKTELELEKLKALAAFGMAK